MRGEIPGEEPRSSAPASCISSGIAVCGSSPTSRGAGRGDSPGGCLKEQHQLDQNLHRLIPCKAAQCLLSKMRSEDVLLMHIHAFCCNRQSCAEGRAVAETGHPPRWIILHHNSAGSCWEGRLLWDGRPHRRGGGRARESGHRCMRARAQQTAAWQRGRGPQNALQAAQQCSWPLL